MVTDAWPDSPPALPRTLGARPSLDVRRRRRRCPPITEPRLFVIEVDRAVPAEADRAADAPGKLGGR